MLKTASVAYGLALIAVGLSRFVPSAMPHGLIFGVFMMGPGQSVVHLALGALALFSALVGMEAIHRYFQFCGLFYVFVAALGLLYGSHPMLGFVHQNRADIALQFGLALVALYLGFGIDPLLSADTHNEYI